MKTEQAPVATSWVAIVNGNLRKDLAPSSSDLLHYVNFFHLCDQEEKYDPQLALAFELVNTQSRFSSLTGIRGISLEKNGIRITRNAPDVIVNHTEFHCTEQIYLTYSQKGTSLMHELVIEPTPKAYSVLFDPKTGESKNRFTSGPVVPTIERYGITINNDPSFDASTQSVHELVYQLSCFVEDVRRNSQLDPDELRERLKNAKEREKKLLRQVAYTVDSSGRIV